MARLPFTRRQAMKAGVSVVLVEDRERRERRAAALDELTRRVVDALNTQAKIDGVPYEFYSELPLDDPRRLGP